MDGQINGQTNRHQTDDEMIRQYFEPYLPLGDYFEQYLAQVN